MCGFLVTTLYYCNRSRISTFRIRVIVELYAEYTLTLIDRIIILKSIYMTFWVNIPEMYFVDIFFSKLRVIDLSCF